MQVRDHFPNPIDGYLYLIRLDKGWECRRFSYGDNHPWKDYPSSNKFVEFLTEESGDNLIASVDSWNRYADQKKEKQAIDRAARQSKFESWLAVLPGEIFGFHRENSELFDQHGNMMFSLDMFAYKDAKEIEVEISAILEDGGFE
jgi:hypothetical protein